MRPFLFAMVFLMCVAGFSAARAQTQDVMFYIPVPPDLADFVRAQTHLKLPDNLQIAVIDNSAPILRHEASWAPGISVTATGVEISGQIFLPVSSVVHLQEDATRAVVVHELTHVAQEAVPNAYACGNRREEQAYTLQNLYLAQHDLPPTLDEDALATLHDCTVVAQTE